MYGTGPFQSVSQKSKIAQSFHNKLYVYFEQSHRAMRVTFNTLNDQQEQKAKVIYIHYFHKVIKIVSQYQTLVFKTSDVRIEGREKDRKNCHQHPIPLKRKRKRGSFMTLQ